MRSDATRGHPPTSSRVEQTPGITTTTAAVGLATAHPEALLPCPWCAVAVKGANLEHHRAKVHAGDGAPADATTWRGPERLIARPLFALPTIAFVAAVAWATTTSPEDDTIVLALGFAFAIGWIVAAAVLLGAPLFPGWLRLHGDGATLTHTLGLRRRRVRTIRTVEIGSAYERRSGAGATSASGTDGGPTVEKGAGAYLRLRDGRRHITVHCREGTPLKQAWAGWEQGRRTRRWHVTLSAPEFVALQYALAERGLLTLRR